MSRTRLRRLLPAVLAAAGAVALLAPNQATAQALTAPNPRPCFKVADAPPAPATAPAGFTAITPARVLDTREFFAGGVPGGGVFTFSVSGRVPASATAVMFSVKAPDGFAPGFVTLWDYGSGRPATSTINPAPGSIPDNEVVVPISPSGELCGYASVTTHVVVDLVGYYTPAPSGIGPSGRMVPVDTQRLLDTRSGLGGIKGPVGPGEGLGPQQFDLQVTGQVNGQGTGVPASGVQAVVLNITATRPFGTGFVSAWPSGQPWPGTSTLDLDRVGTTVANKATVKVGPDGKVTLFTSTPVQLIVDIQGYVTDGNAPEGTNGYAMFTGQVRIADTRVPGNSLGARLEALQPRDYFLAASQVVPENASGVLLNATVTNTGPAGYLTLYAGGIEPPVASNANWIMPNQNLAAGALVRVSHDNVQGARFAVVVNQPTDLIFDVVAWLTS